MKKKVLSALLCAAMVVSMTACGLKAPEAADTTTSQTTDAAAATDATESAAATEAGDSTGTEPVGPAVSLVYAEVNPLEGTIVGQTATAFKEKVEELSGGSITIDIQAKRCSRRRVRCTRHHARRRRYHRYGTYFRIRTHKLRRREIQSLIRTVHIRKPRSFLELCNL